MNRAGVLSGLVLGIFLALFLISPPSASGSIVLFDNLANSYDGANAAAGPGWLAQAIDLSASPVSYSLASVDIFGSTALPGTTVSVDLYSDTGGSPGGLVGHFTNPLGLTSSNGDNIFQGTGLTLNANTLYWIVLSTTSGEFDWGYTNTNTGLGPGFTALWAPSVDGGATWFSQLGSPLLMQATGDAVPIPGAVWLLGSGLAGLGVFRRFRRG